MWSCWWSRKWKTQTLAISWTRERKIEVRGTIESRKRKIIRKIKERTIITIKIEDTKIKGIEIALVLT